MTLTTPPTAPAPAVPDLDRVGAIEESGVEYLPEDARDSSPRNLGAVFLGANLTWTNVVFGAFAVMFGLSASTAATLPLSASVSACLRVASSAWAVTAPARRASPNTARRRIR